MPKETYQAYSAMEIHLLSGHVRQISTNIEGLHSALDDTLSLLIRVKCDLDNYLDHNPCQVCSVLQGLGRVFADYQRDGGDLENPSIPAPPYQPSPLHSGVPGSLGERVEGDQVATPASLPSLIPNSSSSFSSQFTDGDEVSISDSYSLCVFTEFGYWSSQSGVCQPGRFLGEEDPVPMGDSISPRVQSSPSFPFDSSLRDRFPPPLHSHESRILSGFFDSPTLVSTAGESSSDSLS